MILFLLFLFLSLTSPVFATNEFTLNQNITYQVDNQGNASVTQDSELTNNYSEIFPKNYQINISSTNITNITSNDNSGNIIQKTEQQNDQTIIYLKFNQASIGKNQITKFNLNYNIQKFATKKGNTWEISLPDFTKLQENDSINLTINVPSSFGNLSFASSTPKSITNLNQQTQLYFATDNIKNKNILLIFGDYQLFDFNLKYFLTNSKNYQVTEQIAIPPQTDNQKITYQIINPPPQDIKIDPDGNWLAQYQLEARENLEINLSGQAKIIHSNKNQTNIDNNQYLKSQIFWPTQNSTLIEIATSLKTPKDIYQYVINTLNYNSSNLEYSTRKGADNAIASPNQSICTEFTDLFITLARIKGIPAREVEGFAYSNNPKIKPINDNTDILHAWPQYYDINQKSWISIDPTWGKTTSGVDFFNDLDPNHFAFVFHGLDSQNPAPPGFYKNDQNIKTVDVKFAQQELNQNYFPVEIKPETKNIFQKQTIKITNPNFNALTNLNFSINNTDWYHNIDVIAPLSSIEIELPNFQFLPKFKISIKSNNTQTTNFSINNHKFYLNLVIITGLIITLVGIGGIIFNRKKHQK
ncbi:MAG: transglutaminase-like domain-containing protein [Candidatus Shapirobacteria bacterium]|nr:transglutaminase-like domain-containing protein [Candidatus Shapirobacteria bacterium]